jgi:cytochrome c-type biogenesis protein CcmH
MRFLRGVLLVFALLVLSDDALHAASSADVEDRSRAIATELRCVVCQNLSVADSPSEMAQQMRAIVREQVKAGKSPEEIKNFFVSKYGEWVLLKPKTTGFAALLWILPYTVLILGLLAALWFLRRWSSARKAKQASTAAPPVDEPTRRKLLSEEFARPELEESSPRATLLREQGQLKAELADLEFDFQSGKFSDSDYAALKQEIETRAATAIEQLHALPAAAPAQKTAEDKTTESAPTTVRNQGQIRRWQLIAGGLFLMLFGLALGVMLTKSTRPRSSESDLITGDFLTGTNSSSGDVRTALDEGKRAFGNQEFPKAIEAFKKVLATDPNNPEAHSYMGFILVQAGHGDGALMAFDKALSQAPNFPMALWGKGLVLYQDKKDYAAAREIFARLMDLVPPGEERNEIAKVLGEIPTTGGQKSKPGPAGAATAASVSSAQVTGKITIDPKLKTKLDPNAALFIIARPAGGAGGPPLAVKKIDHPSFPLDYSLSQENVMMQGMPFTGKINITIRLDKDGNPVTRTPGDMSGEYKKNPVDAGTKNVDVVIDQETR